MGTSRTRASAFLLVFLLSASFLQSLALAPVAAAPAAAASPSAVPGYHGVGPAPDSMKVLVNIAVPLRNTAALSSLAQQISDPHSPLYRHFLTFSQIEDEFLPTSAFDSMLRYLGSTGLRVESTAMNSIIVAEGTAGQVRSAFGSGVEVYTNGTASYYALSGNSVFDGSDLYVSNATGLFASPMLPHEGAQGNVTFTEGAFSAKSLQAVYNATGLYSEGYDGSGQTIGILDFYGSPTIASDLSQFDSEFGFASTTMKITPIGPYDPNIGAFVGWSTEISLDVETSHAMAPGAKIDLYIGNGAISLVSAIAQIDQDNSVTSLSQSFTFPEWYYSYLGPGFFLFNGLLVDEFYQIGSMEGITFSGSTGDSGGSGYSSGPLGNLGYPASSPFVTAVGGTQTYFSGQGSSTTFKQTAWSNIGFVPDYVNEGGGTGGVSLLEPRPWYQAGEAVPASYPNGRMNPDVSLQGGVDPGTNIVDAGQTFAEGGTSESSPLFAGLAALVASAAGGRLGFIAPTLYGAAAGPSTRAKVFEPVTFGYNVPWTASADYNLVTGLGALNAGGLAALLSAQSTVLAPLNVTVGLAGGVDIFNLEYTQAVGISVNALITNVGAAVSTGSFTASLTTLEGAGTPVALTYDPATGNWTGHLPVGAVSGIGFVTVTGDSGPLSGTGIGVVFVGYLGQFSLFPTLPYTTAVSGGLPVLVNATDLDGAPYPGASLSYLVNTYSIRTNTYTTADDISMAPLVIGGSAIPGLFDSNLTAFYKTGPVDLVIQGSTYGYLPFINGIYLQSTEIFSEVAAEPGAVAPGQDLTVVANPFAPENVAGYYSFETGLSLGTDIQSGSNVTALLLGPSGSVVSSASLVYGACTQALRVCSGQPSINGQLSVPTGSTSGLYTILLTANYSSYTAGLPLNGSFYSQVWVSGAQITPKITVAPSTLYEGGTAKLVANVAYSNGTEVKYGEYTALVYPQQMKNDYASLMHSEYANSELVPLEFSATLNRWVANVTLPSPSNAGVVAPLIGGTFDFSGPYQVYVTGISYDGVPTTTSLSAAQPFYIQPYVLADGVTLSSASVAQGLAIRDSTIDGPATLSNDVLLGTNTIQGGTVTIVDSQLQGSLVAYQAQVELVGVSGGSVTAYGGSVGLEHSNVGMLNLTGATVTMSGSSFQSIVPALPGVTFPAPPPGPIVSPVAMVTGQGISTVTGSLDGQPLGSAAGVSGQDYSWSILTAALSDGVHTFTVTVTQSDGMSVAATEYFSSDVQQAAQSALLQSQSQTINGLSSQLASQSLTINGLSSQLQAQSSSLGSAKASLGTQTDVGYAALAIAVVSMAAAVVALGRGRAARGVQGPKGAAVASASAPAPG